MFHETPLFDANRFAPWELFCSAFRASKEAEIAASPIERLHYDRSLLLFSFAYLEALLNYAVQRHAGDENVAWLLRHGKLPAKLDHLEARTGKAIDRVELDVITREYAYLRNETVHFKRTDQQPQFRGQYIQPTKFIPRLQKLSLRVFISTHDEFPYWLTGWNYTGFNGSWRDLFLSNNGNGFGHSLHNMGFRFRPLHGPRDPSFAQGHMSTIEHFDEIQRFLGAYERESEPVQTWAPLRPRLLRTWWLQGSLIALERETMLVAGQIRE